MSEAKAIRHVSDISDLMEIVALSEIRPFELSARVSGPPSEEQNDPKLEMEYSEHVTEEEIHTRFRFVVTTDDANYQADIASIFNLATPCTIDRLVLNDFAERVGFMAAFPYLRESLTASAARLGRKAPLIGLMRPGDLKIEMPE